MLFRCCILYRRKNIIRKHKLIIFYWLRLTLIGVREITILAVNLPTLTLDVVYITPREKRTEFKELCSGLSG
jgi:hypothetical protein